MKLSELADHTDVVYDKQGNVENVNPQIIRQVAKELGELQKDPPEGIKIHVNEEDLTDIQASIEGPCGLIMQ